MSDGRYQGLVANFYDHTTVDVEASKNAGMKVHKTVLMVELKARGAKDSISKAVTEENEEELKVTFPAAWQRFKTGSDKGVIEGTTLLALGLSEAEVRDLQEVDVNTVEALAELNDQYCSKLPQGYVLKEKAKDYLQTQDLIQGGDLLNRMKELEAKVTELTDENEQLKKPKPRGRPKSKKVDDESDAKATV